MKKQVDLSYIESLSFGLRAPIYESLRILKLNFPPLLYEVIWTFISFPKLKHYVIEFKRLQVRMDINSWSEKIFSKITWSMGNYRRRINCQCIYRKSISHKSSIISFEAQRTRVNKMSYSDRLFKSSTTIISSKKSLDYSIPLKKFKLNRSTSKKSAKKRIPLFYLSWFFPAPGHEITNPTLTLLWIWLIISAVDLSLNHRTFCGNS